MRDKQSMESDSSIDESNISMEPKPNRITKRPERFGETGALTDDEERNSFEEMLSDDSSDDFVLNQYIDKNQIGESQKRKILHNVDGISKKNKPSADEIHHSSQFPWDNNYDDEFDQLNSSVEKQLSIYESNRSSNGENDLNENAIGQISAQQNSTESIHKPTSVGLNIENDSDKKSTDRQQNSIGVSDSGTGTKMGSDRSQSHSNNSDTRNEYLNEIRDMLVEVLVRVKNLEKAHLTRGTLPMDDGIDKTSFDEFHTFLKLNRLPLQNEVDLNEFENKLNDEAFREIAVSTHSN